MLILKNSYNDNHIAFYGVSKRKTNGDVCGELS